ncbi:hypothetical protein Hanom_Chr08g00751661 [Helianthus anomalus]
MQPEYFTRLNSYLAKLFYHACLNKGAAAINYLWGLKWVIRGEMNIDEKHPTRVRAIRRSHYRCLPMKHVLSNRTCYSSTHILSENIK